MNSRIIPALTRNGLVSILLEPQEGHFDTEIISVLKEEGAEEVHLLSPGFISAQVSPDKISALEEIAHIEIKSPHGLRK
jgi:hypothetical protein